MPCVAGGVFSISGVAALTFENTNARLQVGRACLDSATASLFVAATCIGAADCLADHEHGTNRALRWGVDFRPNMNDWTMEGASQW